MRPCPSAERGQLGDFGGAVPEIRAQGGDHPHRARARQADEKLYEQPPVLANSCDREQLLQLIDDQDELGVLEGKQAAVLAVGLRQMPERVGEQKARLAAAQMGCKLCRVLSFGGQLGQPNFFFLARTCQHPRQAKEHVGAFAPWPEHRPAQKMPCR